MNVAWLWTVVAVTQVPDGFLERPEVREFLGPPRCHQEQYAAIIGGAVAVTQELPSAAPSYYVLDAHGRIAADATRALRQCVPELGRASWYPQLRRLAGERGVVVEETCLVVSTRKGAVGPVHEIWGEAWESLVDPTGLGVAPSDELIKSFRSQGAYCPHARSPATEPTAIELPDSPFSLVMVQGTVADDALSFQKVFVVERSSGKIRSDLTAALGRELRDEHAAVCGVNIESLDVVPGGVRVAGARWEDDEGCTSVIRWDESSWQLLVEAHQARELIDLQRLQVTRARLDAANEDWRRGKRERALQEWTELVAAHDAIGAEACRRLGQAHMLGKRRAEARTQLEECLTFGANQGETHLLLGQLLEADDELIEALMHYQLASSQALSEADRATARGKAAELHLRLVESALQLGHISVAYARLASLSRDDLSPAQLKRLKKVEESIR